MTAVLATSFSSSAGSPPTASHPTAKPARRPLAGPGGRALRVLVVDDEPALTELLGLALRYEGWDVRTADNGLAAVTAARDFGPDLVVLDVMMPHMDGFQTLQRLRAEHGSLPVMFLTARDAVEDRIAGLSAGGDDYLTKPFSLEELVLRLRSLVTRFQGGDVVRSSALVVDDLVLDEDSLEVSRAGEPISLTATEFELLRFLMRNARRVMSKAQILDRVWHYDFGGKANIVELYISYLRKKIDTGRTPLIHTVRGFGYVVKPAARR